MVGSLRDKGSHLNQLESYPGIGLALLSKESITFCAQFITTVAKLVACESGAVSTTLPSSRKRGSSSSLENRDLVY